MHKILFVSEYYPPKIMGGGEINLSLLAKSLAKRGFSVSVLTSFHPGLKKYEEAGKVKIYRRLKTGNSPSGLLSNMKRSIILPESIINEVEKLHEEKSNKKEKFDIIHLTGISVIAASKLKRLKVPLFATIESYPSLCPKGDRFYCGNIECKYVCSFRKFLYCQEKSSEIGKTKNKWYLKYNPLFLTYIYKFYRKINKSLKHCNLIAISQYVQKVLLQHGVKSVVIPNAIDENQFSTNIRKKTDKKKLHITYLGSLTKYKGPQILLHALKKINPQKNFNYQCDLYGDGPLKAELNRIIMQNNLNTKIHLPVPYEKVPQIYANSDVIIFPSLWPEPFGRIAIEAMAAGKVVIGSTVGGIKETINRDSGILVAPGKVNELYDALFKVKARAAESRRSSKDNGKDYIKNNYSEKVVLKELIKFYQKIMSPSAKLIHAKV